MTPRTSRRGRSAARRLSIRVLVAAALLSAPVAQARAAETKSTRYLTPQSVAALTIRPARLVAAPGLADLPVEVAQAACQKYLGAPLSTVDRVTAIVEPPLGVTPFYAIALHFTERVSLDGLHADLVAGATPEELGGRPILVASSPGMPSFHLANARTILIGSRPMLEKLDKRDGPLERGPLVAAMGVGGGDLADLQGAVVLEPLRPLVQLGLGQAKSMAPPEFHKFFDAADLLSGAIVTADFTGANDSAVTVYAKSPEAADQFEGLLKELAAMMRQRVLEDSSSDYQRLAASEDPVEKAYADYLARSFERQSAMLTPKRSGSKAFDLMRVKKADQGQAIMTAAVVGVAVAALLPAVQAARAAAQRVQEQSMSGGMTPPADQPFAPLPPEVAEPGMAPPPGAVPPMEDPAAAASATDPDFGAPDPNQAPGP